MNLVTALEIYNNYPDQILINSIGLENGKFVGHVYRLKGESIHKILLSTQPVYDTAKAAEDYLHGVCQDAALYVKLF
jgi:hypothetical protein